MKNYFTCVWRIPTLSHKFLLAEFKLIDGKAPFDLILEQTDPDKVFVELDFFWAAMANVNAYQYFEQFPGRFRLGHVKDMATDVQVAAEGFDDIGSLEGDSSALAWLLEKYSETSIKVMR